VCVCVCVCVHVCMCACVHVCMCANLSRALSAQDERRVLRAVIRLQDKMVRNTYLTSPEP
jgi:hypothetical protein